MLLLNSEVRFELTGLKMLLMSELMELNSELVFNIGTLISSISPLISNIRPHISSLSYVLSVGVLERIGAVWGMRRCKQTTVKPFGR